MLLPSTSDQMCMYSKYKLINDTTFSKFHPCHGYRSPMFGFISSLSTCPVKTRFRYGSIFEFGKLQHISFAQAEKS